MEGAAAAASELGEQHEVKAIDAPLKLSKTRLAQMTQLFERDSGRNCLDPQAPR